MRAGLLWRVGALGVLGVCCPPVVASQAGILAGFGLVTLASPVLVISGPALAAALAPMEKSEAIGLYNASSALAGAPGATLGGLLLENVRYGPLCLGSPGVVGVAVLAAGLLRQNRMNEAATAAI